MRVLRAAYDFGQVIIGFIFAILFFPFFLVASLFKRADEEDDALEVGPEQTVLEYRDGQLIERRLSPSENLNSVERAFVDAGGFVPLTRFDPKRKK